MGAPLTQNLIAACLASKSGFHERAAGLGIPNFMRSHEQASSACVTFAAACSLTCVSMGAASFLPVLKLKLKMAPWG